MIFWALHIPPFICIANYALLVHLLLLPLLQLLQLLLPLFFYLLPIANVCGGDSSLRLSACLLLRIFSSSPVNIALQYNYFSFSCLVFFNASLSLAVYVWLGRNRNNNGIGESRINLQSAPAPATPPLTRLTLALHKDKASTSHVNYVKTKRHRLQLLL